MKKKKKDEGMRKSTERDTPDTSAFKWFV